MTLTAHAVAGGVTAGVLSFNPVLALVGALMSHFLLDAIPHWDYKLRALEESNQGQGLRVINRKHLLFDIVKVLSDILLGLIMVFFLLAWGHPALWLIMIGAIMAMVPDGLQFFYIYWKHPFLSLAQAWHNFCHSSVSLNSRPIVGLVTQIGFLVIVWGSAVWLIGI